METLREQREQDVIVAAREEHEAWLARERATGRPAREERVVREYRERWRRTARSLVGALEALKNRR